MSTHFINGSFQSDKYPTCPPGKVPLSVNDVTAQDLLWEYAQRRRAVDTEFADDLETALRAAGYEPDRVSAGKGARVTCWEASRVIYSGKHEPDRWCGECLAILPWTHGQIKRGLSVRILDLGASAFHSVGSWLAMRADYLQIGINRRAGLNVPPDAKPGW